MYKYASSYCQNAKQIIQSYSPSTPFASFLKQYFTTHKKFGSKDRKAITEACYAYFRLGKAVNNIEIEKAIAIGIFLTEKHINLWQNILSPEWMDALDWDLNEKIDFLQKQAILPDNFNPFFGVEYVSKNINVHNFSLSHLQQPNTFIRVRPKFQKEILKKLQSQNIEHKIQNNSIAFEQKVNIESFAILNKEVVVQDFSSQQLSTLMQLIPSSNNQKKVWDCCAASGGKSILAVDFLGKIELHVSDVRQSILHNLKKRLAVAQIPIYSCEVKDLSKPQTQNNLFDIIIADVPCTGSGTWGRTPENLLFFDEKEIATFQQLQQKIITNSITALKQGGYYLFITCSVFTKENEDNVQFIQTHFGLEVIQQQYFIGYENKADTMFGALMMKPKI